MKILHVTTRRMPAGWLVGALRADSAAQLMIEEVLGAAAGCARLRDETFEAIAITHQPDLLDALEMVEGLRAGGLEEPLIVLGTAPEQELAPLCLEVGADAYCAIPSTTTRALVWTLARAVQRHTLVCENRRLVESQRQRLQREREEAERLVEEQRALARRVCPSEEKAIEGELASRYQNLLRAYLIMGSGHLGRESAQAAEMLRAAGLTGSQVLAIHVRALEELVRGLGKRGARHVIARADLLILEVLVHLTAGTRPSFLSPCP